MRYSLHAGRAPPRLYGAPLKRWIKADGKSPRRVKMSQLQALGVASPPVTVARQIEI
jgi:hypothetical protein